MYELVCWGCVFQKCTHPRGLAKDLPKLDLMSVKIQHRSSGGINTSDYNWIGIQPNGTNPETCKR